MTTGMPSAARRAAILGPMPTRSPISPDSITAASGGPAQRAVTGTSVNTGPPR